MRFFTFILIFIFAACSYSPQRTPEKTPVTEIPVPEVSADKAIRGPFGDWDKVVKEAKKEGKVVLYTTLSPESQDAFAQGFQKAYGIIVKKISGNDAYLVQKIATEKRAGLNVTDVFDGGTDNCSEQHVPEKNRTPTGIKVHWANIEELTKGSTEEIQSLAKFLTGRTEK